MCFNNDPTACSVKDIYKLLEVCTTNIKNFDYYEINKININSYILRHLNQETINELSTAFKIIITFVELNYYKKTYLLFFL